MISISARKSAQRRKVVSDAMQRPVFVPHDADDSAEDRLMRAMRAEQRRRPDWAMKTLADAGALSMPLLHVAERLMTMVDKLEPRGGGSLSDSSGSRGFDPGDPERVFAGERALGPAHAAQLKRGLIAADIAAVRAAVRVKLGIRDEETFWTVFRPIRPSVAEVRAARAVSYQAFRALMETGLTKAEAALASIERDKRGADQSDVQRLLNRR